MEKSNQYFASRVGSEFAAAVMERVKEYYQGLETSGRLALYKRLANSYHLGYFRGGKLNQSGEQDEFTMMHANHFRNILDHMVTMTTSQRPAFEPRATNTDYKSKAQTIVSRGVLDYYNREKGMGESAENCTEGGVLFGETETLVEWDSQAGDPYMASPDQQGDVLPQGDVTFREFGPIDCIRDLMLTSAKKMTWRVYRDFANRHDLAARYPEARDRILNLSVDSSLMSNRWLSPWSWRNGDIVPFYTFYHDKTPACPNGRVAVLIDAVGPLLDGGLPYDAFPGFRLAPNEQSGTPFGYSIAFDLLPIQEAIDILYSVVTTNQANFGVQNILIPEGGGLNLKQLTDGLNAIYFDPKHGKPEGLNLTSTPPEIFNFIGKLEGLMETLSGVNSVTRGDPAANLKSGAALALVQSMAIQFNSKLQKAYARQVENTGTAVVKILGKFPKTKRMVEIVGKANRTYLKEFEAKDLAGISRVTVDMGNPLSRTTAGKVQMAEDLLKNKLIENADQYIQVLTTGNLDPLIEGKQAELMLISSENELLSEGKTVMAVVTDDHALHAYEHKSVLASPEARNNPEIVKATTAHLSEHIKILEQLSASNPNLLIALGQTPVQPPPAPGGGAPPAGPGAPEKPPVGAPSIGKTLDVNSPAAKAAGIIPPPNMPVNPLDGQRFPAPPPVAAI